MTITRPRDANATRNNILDAARSLFAQAGYDGTNLRQVAELAECNVALVSRYFGGKDNLFREVVLEGFTLEAIVIDDRSKFGEHLARYILSKRERGTLEPLLPCCARAATRTPQQSCKICSRRSLFNRSLLGSAVLVPNCGRR